jgi:hypothetical protein
MTRYFFKIVDGTALKDPSGLDCRDDADAVSKGMIIAREIAGDNRRTPAVSQSRTRPDGRFQSFP